MLDLKFIRDNTTEVIAKLHYRMDSASKIKILLMRDAEHRTALQALEKAQHRRNEITGLIQAEVSKGGKPPPTLLEEMAGLKTEIVNLTEQERQLGETVQHLLAMIPNFPMPGIPIGPDEDHNVELRRVGEAPKFSFTPKEHFELGGAKMDFETGAMVSGSRYVFLKGELARLERALGQFMIDFHTKWNGYTEVSPPLIVNEAAMFGTGQLPKFAEDLYRTGEQFLIPTAEVSLTNMFRETISSVDDLGRFCALTPCFRAEAGSAGRDTRGMIRQHQFYKVELVSVVDEKTALTEHDRMVESVESILKALGLHYRAMVLSTGDMGFSARKTIDLEVWLPGQNTFREISSISYCGDFQARRMNARYRPAGEQKGTKFVHTFNGSGVAVGRALVAILENYQNEDGSISIPTVLRPYLDGQSVILSKDRNAEAFIQRLNDKLALAGLEDRVSLNPIGAHAAYGIEGPYMAAGYSDRIDLERFVDILIENKEVS